MPLNIVIPLGAVFMNMLEMLEVSADDLRRRSADMNALWFKIIEASYMISLCAEQVDRDDGEDGRALMEYMQSKVDWTVYGRYAVGSAKHGKEGTSVTAIHISVDKLPADWNDCLQQRLKRALRLGGAWAL